MTRFAAPLICFFLCIAPVLAAPADDLVAMGREALSKRDVAAAMEAYDKALAADPAHAEAAYERGRLLLVIGEHQNAIADFTTAILGRPDFGRAYVGRAEAKLAIKDGPGAIADFNQAIAVSPRDFEVHVSRAAFRLKIGNIAGAKADLNNAKTLADPVRAATIQKALDKLR
jgi:tetratricopeptide (TPR) repeat protein